MAGICIICKNLEKIELIFDRKKLEGCRCNKGKFDENGLYGYYSLQSVIKANKPIKEIQDNCDIWDDALKGKDTTL